LGEAVVLDELGIDELGIDELGIDGESEGPDGAEENLMRRGGP
jgi:hypothetical protein